MSTKIPSVLNGIYDTEIYANQQSYQKANSNFSLKTSYVSFLIILLALFFGFFGKLDTFIRESIENPILAGLLFFCFLYIISELVNIPLDYYRTFVIEEKFGFNKTTHRLFYMDKIKSLFLTIVLGGLLLALIIWIYYTLGDIAWLVAWGGITFVSIFLMFFYSNLIVPLFNKQTPLESGELKDAIYQFAQKAGFGLKDIYVMDASRRSSKGNAYFTGFGAKKRIILYDTLIDQLDTNQIVAVLAHEIGHYKKKHVILGVTISVLSTGLMLFLLSFFIGNREIAQSLGTSQPSFEIGVIAFSLIFSPLSMLLGIGSNILSRNNEFQADQYASQFELGDDLIAGLKKLSISSLSNLTPDPLYVFVNYSHPPLLERINAIKSK